MTLITLGGLLIVAALAVAKEIGSGVAWQL
jgi:hypothetical protein